MFLPGEFHGWGNLAGYSPWGRRESDMTEQPSLTHTHTHINTHTHIYGIYKLLHIYICKYLMQTYVYMYQYISTKLHIYILKLCISKFLYYVATYGEGQTTERS